MSKKKPKQTEADQLAIAMRLVNQDTVHGKFLRYGWVTFNVVTGRVVKFEPLPVVYNTEEEAQQTAAQIAGAANMPVVELSAHLTTHH